MSHAVGLGRHAGTNPSHALYQAALILTHLMARGGPTGHDAGKKAKGKKRHLLVDSLGLILAVAVHPADLRNRDGALPVLDRHRCRRFPFLETIFADGA